MNSFTLIFLTLLLISISLQLWLIKRQINNIKVHRHRVPPPFNQKITLENHQKAADYTLSKIRFEMISIFFHVLILLIWTIGGGLTFIDQLIRSYHYSVITNGLILVSVVLIIMAFIEIPFSLYRTFFLEERYGFNKTTPATFWLDNVMEVMLSLLIGLPLIALTLWLMQPAPDASDLSQVNRFWWFYVWVVWILFSFFMLWAYPVLIAPLFNKFTSLNDQELDKKIKALLEKSGFISKGIFIMDGSRRSSHGNAYFTGFGKQKRIVFFDTLLKSLSHNEIEAVLAHELGHFKHHHIQKQLLSTTLISLAGLILLDWLLHTPWFYSGLGVEYPSNYMALVLFMFIMPVLSPFVSPIMLHFTRKHEYEADAYAVEHANANELINALLKLYEDNAATLTPDSLYSAFHDSHPPAPVRISYLSDMAGSGSKQ